MKHEQRPFILRLINALFYGSPQYRHYKRAKTQKHRKPDKPPDTAKPKPKEPEP